MKIFFILLLILTFSIPLALPRVIYIQKVQCSSQFGSCSEILSKKLEEAQIKTLREAKLFIKNILENEAIVSGYSMRFKLPASIEVSIIERKSEVAISNLSGKGFYLVDKNGVIVGFGEKSDLPTLFTNQETFYVGQKLDGEMLFSTKLAHSLYRTYQTRKLRLDQEKIEGTLGDYTVIFPVNGDINVLLGSLDLILSRLSKERETIKINVIDLRFKNPVLK